MKLSIIIPCKNEEANLPKLFASIQKQTFTDYEIIVADAASTDRTAEIATAAGARVIPGGMPGPGRNKGAAQAKGDVFLFLDADVELDSDRYLEDILKEFDEKKADVATCRVEPDSELMIDHVFHDAYNAFIKLTERIHPHAPGFCILVRRHVHEQIKGFDENVPFAEDLDYVLRATKAKFRFRVLHSHPIHVSVRRFEQDGRWNIAMKYLYTKLHMIMKGSFKNKMPFEYEMGGNLKPKSKKLKIK